MQCTIGLSERQRWWGTVGHTLAVLGLLGLMVLGPTAGECGGLGCLSPPSDQVGGGAERGVSEKVLSLWICLASGVGLAAAELAGGGGA